MMFTVNIIKRVKKQSVESTINLAEEFPNAPESDLKSLFDGCHHDFEDEALGKENDKTIWSYRRLYQLAFEMDIKSALDVEVLKEYHQRTEAMISEKPSQRSYRGYFKTLVSALCPEHTSLFNATARKGRSDRGQSRSRRYTVSEPSGRTIDMSDFHNVEENVANTAEVLSSSENTRKRTAPTEDDLLMVPSNIVEFNPLILQMKTGNNRPVEIDLREFLDYDFCDEKLLLRVAKAFRNSQLKPATKHCYLTQLGVIFEFKKNSGNKNEPISDRLFKAYLYDLHDKVRRGVIKNKANTVSQYQRYTNSLLPLFGLKRVTKAELIKVKAGGNELESDAYSDPEWKMIVRALILDRKRLANIINASDVTVLHEQTINDYMANVLLMTAVYTAATQTELFTATYPDQVVSYARNGKDHWITQGVKNRADEIRHTELKFKQNGKRMYEEFLPISRKVNALCQHTEYQLFVALDNGVSREFNSGDLYSYENRLINANPKLREYKETKPEFTIRTQRIRSSITSKVQTERGEGSSVVSGRHSIRVHRTSKYGRNNKQINQKELAAQTRVMEHFGRNEGNIKLAIESVEDEFDIQVLTPAAAKKIREENSNFNDIPNGGTCQNKETKEKQKFQHKIDSNPLLTEADKKLMGCGFIINCFWCENFAVVDEVIDIWRLLSFEQKVKDTFSEHQDIHHFLKNYGDLQLQIAKLKSKFTPLNLRVATKRLETEIHPFWADEYAIFDVLRDLS